ncbi:MAG: PA14 domain-containing protein [Planctomycetaceae bacterium]|nr:PA14 domain-containing protein [Planctomycetaceae bacterium]
MLRPTIFHILLITLCLPVQPFCAVAAAEDFTDADFHPGLLATYRSHGQRVQRIDPVLSFQWGGDAADDRLPAGPFDANWESWLLVKTPGTHRFHAFVIGSLQVTIDDQVVLQADNQRGFVSGENVTLTAGDHELKVVYESPAESDKPQARLSVYWSSDSFTLEPVPADVLYREELHDAQLADYGRALADSFRCAACHQTTSHLPPLPGPALDRVRGSQPLAVLTKRLQNPRSVVPNSHMPDFGFTPQQANRIAQFLTSISKKSHPETKQKTENGDVSAGQRLLLSTGCVACHNVSAATQKFEDATDTYAAPDLASVGQRRTPAWLDRWLRDPASLNADHRMPGFELSKDERRQIVAALTEKTADATGHIDQPDGATDADLAAGRQLVIDANCAACHAIPGLEPVSVPLESFSPDAGHCFASARPAATASGNTGEASLLRPRFDLDELKNRSLTTWLTTGTVQSAINAVDKGAMILARNRCLSCHDRDTVQGLSLIAGKLQKLHPDLEGQSQGLVPPSLTAVGDKLQTDYLSKAVKGEQAGRRLPWLMVQMPRFRHSDQETSWLLQHFQATDLIPPQADSARADVLSHIDLTGQHSASAQQLLTGNQLTGAAGFNCVACHQAGPFQPRNVALGTRGSDLMTMGSRIRPRYFQRWMKNPIRVVAGIEMPAIRKGMPDVLEGSLPAQLGVIWTALADSRFTPPTVTSRFEQIASVTADDPPLILRDVFTIGTDAKTFEPVARAFAVGLPSGHSLLIDLDTMNLRLWTYGEFARQRTEGKSWYWDMPGSVIRRPLQTTSIQTVTDERGRVLAPVEDEGRVCELLSYDQKPGFVQLRTRSWYRTNEAPSAATERSPHAAETAWSSPTDPLTPVIFEHTIRPRSSGFEAIVSMADAPPGWRPADVTQETFGTADSLIASQVTVQRLDGPAPGVMITGEVSGQLPPRPAPRELPRINSDPDRLTSTPGFVGSRLPIDGAIMPTAITWLDDGRMAFTSLKGHVWIADDTDGDGIPDRTQLFEEGLAAPFGILTDGRALLVAHKPEVLRLEDTDGDGRADRREVVASGWGYSDNYHDWASGLVRDEDGHLYVGLGSDYSQKKRPVKNDRWRGGVVKIDPSGVVTPFSLSMRYPMDIAIDHDGHVFATDNQGVQNTFNEINHLLPGRHYGVPSRHQPVESLQAEEPAVMVPHPWSRSVNSILFLPDTFAIPGLRGHGIGCEYDSRFLMRFTVQDVNGTLQGASYRFSRPDQEAGGSNFIGPICSAVSPEGELYIGSIWDSGWQGGRNTGGISRLAVDEETFPNGIQEIRAVKGGFEVEFFEPVSRAAALKSASWNIQAFTRKWGGSYATPDSDRFTASIDAVDLDDTRRIVRLSVPDHRAGFLYDLTVDQAVGGGAPLWPAAAHYTMKVVP